MTIHVLRAPSDSKPPQPPLQPTDLVAAERHAGVRRALDYLLAGRHGRARYELVRSVMRQARIAGLGDVPIAPACPCGRRCGRA